MKKIQFIVEDRWINNGEQTNITGDLNVDILSFEFDSEWNELTKSIFYNIDGVSYVDNLNSNNEVVLRKEVYNAKNVRFGVFGTKGDEIILSTAIKTLITLPSAWGQIGDIENLPDNETWNMYTQEMLALLAQGNITLEQCNQILENIESFISEAEQIRDTTEGYKNDAQDILEDVQDIKQDIIDMGSSRTFATFYLDASTGDLYVINSSSLGNMGFSVQDGDLYVNINSEVV